MSIVAPSWSFPHLVMSERARSSHQVALLQAHVCNLCRALGQRSQDSAEPGFGGERIGVALFAEGFSWRDDWLVKIFSRAGNPRGRAVSHLL